MTLIKGKTGIWILRVVVSINLREILGKGEFRSSLGTRNRAEAEIKTIPINALIVHAPAVPVDYPVKLLINEINSASIHCKPAELLHF